MSTLKVGTIQDHANSNTAISIDSAGVVSEPNRPCFSYTKSGTSVNDASMTQNFFETRHTHGGRVINGGGYSHIN